jgi:FMN-dependent oxidoreductase (nitrilotriacetate monooxygenase family)
MSLPACKEISINAFYANSPGQNWIGLWSAPGSRAHEYKSLDYWTEVARIAERGLFDSVFFADTNGVHDVYEGSPRATIERAAMFPMNDPLLLIPTMAYVTEHLSFGVTANLSYEPPYALARRFSTLDQLTKGRISWNVVTGFQDSAARAMGLDEQREHDMRYDIAEEYMEVVYKLWEGSWEDDAVVLDRENHVYARADRVHEINHRGQHFRMRGIHLCEPSPQRTPVLFQAGGSERGRAFAARHAECLFLNGLPSRATAERIRGVRDQARALGRDPAHMKFIMMATIVTAPTEAEARDKFEMLASHVDAEGMLAVRSGLSGIDLSKDLSGFVDGREKARGIGTITEFLLKEEKSLERLKDYGSFGPQAGRECFVVGTPSQVAEALITWMNEADIDGFNLQRSGEPQHLIDFVDLVVPELQNRGVYKTAYREGSFREKLFGTGDRLRAGHPAAGHRYVSESVGKVEKADGQSGK